MFTRRNKYKAKRVFMDGYSFQSQLEAALYRILKSELDAGLWKSLRCQVQVKLTKAEITYIPDFEMIGLDDIPIFHEAKGFETPEWRIKRRLWMYYGPAELRVWKGNSKYLKISETIIPDLTSN